MIPEIAVRRELAEGRLVRLDWEEDLETGVLMIRHREKWFSPALAAIMKAFRQAMDAQAPCP